MEGGREVRGSASLHTEVLAQRDKYVQVPTNDDACHSLPSHPAAQEAHQWQRQQNNFDRCLANRTSKICHQHGDVVVRISVEPSDSRGVVRLEGCLFVTYWYGG